MRLLGLSVAAVFGAALYLAPVSASAQGAVCAKMPTKPKNCVDWVCGTTAPCAVQGGGFSAVGCTKWKCNAVARKR